MHNIDTTPMNRRKKLNKKKQTYLLSLLDPKTRTDFELRHDLTLIFYDTTPWASSQDIVGTCRESIEAGWRPDLIIVPSKFVLQDMLACGYLENSRFENAILIYAYKFVSIPAALTDACRIIYDWRDDDTVIATFDSDDQPIYSIPAPTRYLARKAQTVTDTTFRLIAKALGLNDARPWMMEADPSRMRWVDAICHNKPHEHTSCDLCFNPMVQHLLNMKPLDETMRELKFRIDTENPYTRVIENLFTSIEKTSLWLNYAEYEQITADMASTFFDHLERYGNEFEAASRTGYDIIDWLEEHCIGRIPFGDIEATRDIRFTQSLDDMLVFDDMICPSCE